VIQFVKILFKLTKFPRNLLPINASALFPTVLVSKSFVMPLKKYFFFVFLLQVVGRTLLFMFFYAFLFKWSSNLTFYVK
jgi:hypothetical protein